MPILYAENPVSIGDHLRKKRMELTLFQKDVARICCLGFRSSMYYYWFKLFRTLPEKSVETIYNSYHTFS